MAKGKDATELVCVTRLSRVHCSDGPDYFLLTVMDKASRLRVLEMHLPVESMGELLSTQEVKSPGRLYHSSDIGKNQETKCVQVPFAGLGWKNDALETIFKRAEKENPGWVADRYFTFNSHRVRGGSMYEVVIRRWVDTPEEFKL